MKANQTLVALLLMTASLLVKGYAQTDSTLDRQENVQQAFKELHEFKDEFTGKIYYYDKRVDTHNLRGDGMFAGLEKIGKYYPIKLVIYRVMSSEKIGFIEGIIVKAGDTLFELKNPNIAGNGSSFARITIRGIGYNKLNYTYNILHRIVETGVGIIRFKMTNSQTDYALSKREIKELKQLLRHGKHFINYNLKKNILISKAGIIPAS